MRERVGYWLKCVVYGQPLMGVDWTRPENQRVLDNADEVIEMILASRPDAPQAGPLPATIELCTRIRDGQPCLRRISRSGSPEIVHCESCGTRAAGVVYTLRNEALDEFVKAARALGYFSKRFSRRLQPFGPPSYDVGWQRQDIIDAFNAARGRLEQSMGKE